MAGEEGQEEAHHRPQVTESVKSWKDAEPLTATVKSRESIEEEDC